MFVLSTGRCGTLALLKLLERSDQAMAYHTLPWQLSAADRNHLLYRILEGISTARPWPGFCGPIWSAEAPSSSMPSGPAGR